MENLKGLQLVVVFKTHGYKQTPKQAKKNL